MDFSKIAQKAKEASLNLANLSTSEKNEALLAISKGLEQNKERIFVANQADLKLGAEFVEKGELSQSVFNRLKLDDNKMRDMIQGVNDIIKLDDPINKCMLARELDEGLALYKTSCPIGVLGIIFESRPDVITQISALAIKSSNAVILKGGKEAINTNRVLFDVINEALNSVNFAKNVINLVFSREDVVKMLEMDEYIDLIIPRGGNALVKFIKENTKIPVLGHADGVCHLFIDKSADLKMAIDVAIDSKTQYPSACNSIETILIHKSYKEASKLLDGLEKAGIELIESPKCWSIEYSDKVLAVKYIEDVNEAVAHINKYGSGHTDCIVTEDFENVTKFQNMVDSAGVYHNCSTRFADGFRYGFGAEVGISTNKTHARGPVGLDGLTIYKYKMYGQGQVVKDYTSGQKQFHHKDLT